jgi:hypothetical protein
VANHPYGHEAASATFKDRLGVDEPPPVVMGWFGHPLRPNPKEFQNFFLALGGGSLGREGGMGWPTTPSSLSFDFKFFIILILIFL